MYSEQTIKNAEKRAKAHDLLGEVCSKCGTTESLTIDHIYNDRSSYITPSHMIKSSKWDELVAELERCQLLCHSCHARKTHKDNGNFEFAQHGTNSMYNNNNCRCEDCKIAHRNHHRNYRKSLYAKGYKRYNGYMKKVTR